GSLASQEFEKHVLGTAWTDAHRLAKAGDEWSYGGNLQTIAEYAFGTHNCGSKRAKRDMRAALTNARNAFYPSTIPFKSHINVYYHETARYGPPTGDGLPLCQADGSGGPIAYSQNYPGAFWNNYYVVFCDYFWNLVQKNGSNIDALSLRSLDDMFSHIEALKHEGIDQTHNATLLWQTTGSIFLHELHHLVDIVSPRYSGSMYSPRQSSSDADQIANLARDHAYMPQAVHDLALEHGCGDEVSEKDADSKSSLNNGSPQFRSEPF
ncbi:MAG: hypothetical protein Q9191_004760, partial [Dirinaria sp. TL-2023a]